MPKTNDLKMQRDKFLAFSFSSADLLIELDKDGIISFALGAGKSLTGLEAKDIIGKNWLDIFRKEDSIPLAALRTQAKEGKRVGPLCIQINEDLAQQKEGIITGIKMPDNDNFYVTVGFASDLLSRLIEVEVEDSKEEDTPEDFAKSATKAIKRAKEQGHDVDLTMLNIADAEDLKSKLGDTVWDQFTDAIADVLKSQSLDGNTATQLADGHSVLFMTSI